MYCVLQGITRHMLFFCFVVAGTIWRKAGPRRCLPRHPQKLESQAMRSMQHKQQHGQKPRQQQQPRPAQRKKQQPKHAARPQPQKQQAVRQMAAAAAAAVRRQRWTLGAGFGLLAQPAVLARGMWCLLLTAAAAAVQQQLVRLAQQQQQ
jgi:outer membrane biosynthesis protein TonB